MRTLLGAIIIALLAVPAYGQGRGKQPMSDQKQEAPKATIDDKGYKSALDRMPEQTYDPWRNVRDPGKPAPPTK